ncbi:MAG TPA: CRISPR-associated helicase Cas3' [Thermoanaerobaculales bacterium]|nr:CRISPR-associated helicase Cas3' [Thermoanaerobaculales bacterium]
MATRTDYFKYWGKANRALSDSGRHPLVYHCLDVAAVGAVLLSRHPTLLDRLARLTEIPAHSLRPWLLWLLCQHDIGKMATSFQRLREDLWPHPLPHRYRYDVRHDTLGYLLWERRLLDNQMPWSGADVDLRQAMLALARAAHGHHGRPPQSVPWQTTWFREEDIAAASYLLSEFSLLVFRSERPPALVVGDSSEFRRKVAIASWSIAGFAVLADWLGSDRDAFPFVAAEMPLQRYWDFHAVPAAEEVVNRSAIIPVPAAPAAVFSSLFPQHFAPTPLQSAVEETPLSDGPQLIIIEDLTGSGKTEAALELASRLLGGALAESLYFALPTTATADAMYARVSGAYRRLFCTGTTPSLVLAHSRRDLSTEFRSSIGPEGSTQHSSYSLDEDAGPVCSAWLADSRKKALLAQVGVGTIDQALLATLGVRHQPLRMFGLLGKLIVVDEVHACDAYMNELLSCLLKVHAADGGSAVLMSATLPLDTRTRLVRSFCEGAGFDAPEVLEAHYPALLRVGSDGVWHRRVEPPAWCRRALGFQLADDEQEVMRWIIDRSSAGACVCWVRNTVRDAIRAFDELRDVLPEHVLTLFHARFALADRLAIERRVVSAFGKTSDPGERRGRVVVATQVVEQSLDLDFDEIVTDLAPLDLLLQRAGRLRRHPRGRAGELTSGQDLRGKPILQVLSPFPTDDPPANWIRGSLPGTAAVYPHHGQLWLTAMVIESRREVQLPDDLRDIIEEVFGADAQDRIPESLDRSVIDVEGNRAADRALARHNAIEVDLGYGGGFTSWTDLEDARTRLGAPTVTLRLARWDGRHLSPWYGDHPGDWRLSEVSIGRSSLARISEPDDPDLAAAMKDATASWGAAEKWYVLVPLVRRGDEVWSASAFDDRDRSVTVTYHPLRGLEVAR